MTYSLEEALGSRFCLLPSVEGKWQVGFCAVNTVYGYAIATLDSLALRDLAQGLSMACAHVGKFCASLLGA